MLSGHVVAGNLLLRMGRDGLVHVGKSASHQEIISVAGSCQSQLGQIAEKKTASAKGSHIPKIGKKNI